MLTPQRRVIRLFLRQTHYTTVTLNVLVKDAEAYLNVTFSVFVVEPSLLPGQLSIGRKECGNIPNPLFLLLENPIPESQSSALRMPPLSLCFSASLFLSLFTLPQSRLLKQAGCPFESRWPFSLGLLSFWH